MGRRYYILLRSRHNIPIRRLGDVPPRRRWMFHLRLTYDVAGTHRKTSLRRRHDVMLPEGICILLRSSHDIPIRRRGDVPLRRLGDVSPRRRWVFHLRRTCDVAATYRETSL